MEIYFLPALFAFFLTLALTLGALKVFPKWGLMDKPKDYGLKRRPIPYYGGLVILISFLVSVLIFVELSPALIGLLVGAVLIAGVSFLDDKFGLSPFIRLGVQVFAALILVGVGIGITSISNPLGDPIVLDQFKITMDGVYQLSVLGALFTVIWVVSIVNTMNFIDGLNGLASGVSVIAALALFLLSIRPGIHFDVAAQVPVAMLSIILFACAFAFWIFEFHPAKILMGDTGSMFLGFVLATLAIFSGGKIATAFLVMGFPILDAFWVILRRIAQGKSPFKGDLRHLHHRLLKGGMTPRQTLLFIYGLCILFGGIAVFLESMQKLYAIIVMGIFMLVIGGFALAKEKNEDKTI